MPPLGQVLNAPCQIFRPGKDLQRLFTFFGVRLGRVQEVSRRREQWVLCAGRFVSDRRRFLPAVYGSLIGTYTIGDRASLGQVLRVRLLCAAI